MIVPTIPVPPRLRIPTFERLPVIAPVPTMLPPWTLSVPDVETEPPVRLRLPAVCVKPALKDRVPFSTLTVPALLKAMPVGSLVNSVVPVPSCVNVPLALLLKALAEPLA